MITIFELLGRILDSASNKKQFEMVWENDILSVDCTDSDIIGSLILPLLDDDKAYNLIENSDWYYATLKISKDQISQVVLGNDSEMNIVFDIGTKILQMLSEYGTDDTYIKICHEISKKCGFLVDRLNIV